ncbi:hypothetical protein KAR52_00230 [Candidatus Pacearchaeota archaeon]|nr:hypothetical protein [Candidatus Pacearchaeota archaeon]
MKKNKKSEFQKEIESDERRLKEIYDRILGVYKSINYTELTEEYLIA